MNETWMPIPGFPDHEASSHGQIRRVTNGKGKAVPGLVLKQRLRPTGYAVVSIGGKKWFVHRLVCAAFQGACPKGFEASHEDGDRANNSAANLVWRTHADNEARKALHGTRARGAGCKRSNLTDITVIIIRSAARLRLGTHSAIGAMFGISRASVSDIVNYRSWRHVE